VRRPPLPALLRGPGLAVAAAIAVSWRLAGGDAAALVSPEAREAARSFARGFLPPAHDPEFLALLARGLVETVAIGVVGLALALVLAVPLALLATSPRALAAERPPTAARRVAWALARGLLAVLRSVPEVVWALVLVRAFGLGPAAGVGAIGIAYAGVVGKVLAEIFETSSGEPAAALRAAGASPLGAFVHGTLPGAFPVATSYVLYRFDCALRTSAVLGLVGAGGLGAQLELSLKMLAYDEVAAMVLALLALVAAVDLASAAARRALREGRGLLPSGRAGVGGRALVAAAAVAAVVLSGRALGLSARELLSAAPLRAIVSFGAAAFPPELSPAYLRQVAPAAVETLAVSVLGTALAAALGLVLAWVAARPGGIPDGAGPARRAVRAATAWGARGVLEALRTLPELVWALLLVLAVGLGPFAGALALGLHTAGVLGRLYAEVLEEVPVGPVAALEGAGAGRGASALVAILPHAAPQLVAYTLYRWEVNVRASAVLGVVGAGGLGTLLQLSFGLFQVHRTLTLLAVLLVLVLGVELVSGAARHRLIEGPAPLDDAPRAVGAPGMPPAVGGASAG